MAWVLGRLPYSSKYRISSSRGRGAGDVLRCLVSNTGDFSSHHIFRHYYEGTSSDETTDETADEIKTNLKLTANILLKNTQKNIVCSPLSLNFAMNMVAMGSKGDTLDQLLSFIGLTSLEDVKTTSSNIVKVLSRTSKGGPLISFVNGVWVNKMFPIKPSYDDVIRNTFKAEVKNVDREQVVGEVNSWVDKNTKGLIDNILDPTPPAADETAVILANALYFKGVWSKAFYKQGTENRDFHLLNGETVSVPFMTNSRKYYYGACGDFKVLEMPYQTGSDYSREFSMYVLLPHDNDGLKNLLAEINSNPQLLHRDFKLKKVTLDEFWIPKFKFSYQFNAEHEMRQLGLTLPFEENCQDITEMVHTTGEYNVNVIHKAVIEVDEKGTVARASTVSHFGAGSFCPIRETERYEFVADHPFLFMIKEDMTDATLFVGTVVHPLDPCARG